MTNVNAEYDMAAGTSEILEASDESRMLIQSVGNITGTEISQSEKYFVVTDQEDLVEITGVDKQDCTNLIGQNDEHWAAVCRICANTSDHLIPIFEGEGLEHELNNKIHRYLPIQVSEADNLPLHLCYHCAATLLAWHELSEGCLDAEQRLLQMQHEHHQSNQSTILSESLTISSGVPAAEDTEVSSKRHESEEELDVKGEFIQESTTNDSERSTNYIQSAQSSSFTQFRRAYQALLQSYQRQLKPHESLSPENIKPDQWLSVSTVNNGTNRSNPIEANDQLQLVGKQLTATIIIQESVNNVSNDENNSPVRVNNSITTEAYEQPILQEPESMFQGTVSETNVTPENSNDNQYAIAKAAYDCKLCNKKFELHESFRAHMRVHNDAKCYTCHICGKQFGQTGSLYYHLKHVHGGVKQHSCDLCGRSFAMKAAMEDHRRIHTGERPYCCATCGKTFKTKASLYIHSKTHTDELPHKCSYCPKAFRWRQQLLGHLTIHTGQKNHICEICGKRFGVKNDLTRHKRIHSEEKPFVCQQCGLSFGQKRYLKNHERTRHN